MITIGLGRTRLQVLRLSAEHVVVRLAIAAVRVLNSRQIVVLSLVLRLDRLLIVEYVYRLDDLGAEGWRL